MNQELTPCDTALVVDTQTGTYDWCTWEHHAVLAEGEPPTVIMVGACKLSEVYNMSAAKANSEWKRIFARGGKVMVRIVATGPDKHHCYVHATKLMKQYAPVCNLNGHNLKHTRKSIRCINNGRVYNTQAEAARDLGLDQGSVSKHMRGMAHTVQGFMFEYARPEDEG